MNIDAKILAQTLWDLREKAVTSNHWSKNKQSALDAIAAYTGACKLAQAIVPVSAPALAAHMINAESPEVLGKLLELESELAAAFASK